MKLGEKNTDKEMNSLEHIRDLSNQKKERFFKYLREETKKELNVITKESRFLEFKKINGKWQIKDSLYDLTELNQNN
ncbi:hypothetical protein [Leptotrichia wadei]|uniref:Uncharacterized protein n=1 Tax=Leptotrichia wadei TaxID=157687 RepID=A0A510KDT3_9FUSO|nr:hypothetical protein [Leptotrichia wadei]BBM49846.1 hypothetical protein JMUB3934_1142 [Leptotrichia wadei]